MTDVILAVGVIYHAVDMNLFAHVHSKDEREPASAEVGTRLDPIKTETTLFKNLFTSTKDCWKYMDKVIIHFPCKFKR